MKLNRRLRTQTKINSLLIDGEALLKQGFHGAKQVQTKNGSVGTIFHFINTNYTFKLVIKIISYSLRNYFLERPLRGSNPRLSS